MKNNSIEFNIINELYSKCIKQEQDINDWTNEILNGAHKSTAVEKVRDKILEKMENFEESLTNVRKSD